MFYSQVTERQTFMCRIFFFTCKSMLYVIVLSIMTTPVIHYHPESHISVLLGFKKIV